MYVLETLKPWHVGNYAQYSATGSSSSMFDRVAGERSTSETQSESLQAYTGLIGGFPASSSSFTAAQGATCDDHVGEAHSGSTFHGETSRTYNEFFNAQGVRSYSASSRIISQWATSFSNTANTLIGTGPATTTTTVSGSSAGGGTTTLTNNGSTDYAQEVSLLTTTSAPYAAQTGEYYDETLEEYVSYTYPYSFSSQTTTSSSSFTFPVITTTSGGASTVTGASSTYTLITTTLVADERLHRQVTVYTAMGHPGYYTGSTILAESWLWGTDTGFESFGPVTNVFESLQSLDLEFLFTTSKVSINFFSITEPGFNWIVSANSATFTTTGDTVSTGTTTILVSAGTYTEAPTPVAIGTILPIPSVTQNPVTRTSYSTANTTYQATVQGGGATGTSLGYLPTTSGDVASFTYTFGLVKFKYDSRSLITGFETTTTAGTNGYSIRTFDTFTRINFFGNYIIAEQIWNIASVMPSVSTYTQGATIHQTVDHTTGLFGSPVYLEFHTQNASAMAPNFTAKLQSPFTMLPGDASYKAIGFPETLYYPFTAKAQNSGAFVHIPYRGTSAQRTSFSNASTTLRTTYSYSWTSNTIQWTQTPYTNYLSGVSTVISEGVTVTASHALSFNSADTKFNYGLLELATYDTTGKIFGGHPPGAQANLGALPFCYEYTNQDSLGNSASGIHTGKEFEVSSFSNRDLLRIEPMDLIYARDNDIGLIFLGGDTPYTEYQAWDYDL